MTDRPITRRLFIAKAAPLVAAAAMPAATSLAAPAEPIEQMRAIVRHFAAMAPADAGRLMLQIGGTPEAFGYVVHAYVSSWTPDARLRGGGLYREEAIELARVGGSS